MKLFSSPAAAAFRRNGGAMAGLFFLCLIVLTVLLVPLFYTVDANLTDAAAGFRAAPSASHLLGTDDVGRDVLARLLQGGRVSLLVGFGSMILAAVLGVPLGLLAGYFRGGWEYWIMRLVEVVQSFPSMILILCLVSLVGPSVVNVIVVLGFLGWAPVCRLIYGNTLSVSERDYILAAQALGASRRSILFSDILPNAIAPLWAQLPMRVGRAMLTESSLSFLGVGLRTPETSWGNMLQRATELATLTQRPWMWVPPMVCIVLTTLSLQLVGDGIQKALSPREI